MSATQTPQVSQDNGSNIPSSASGLSFDLASAMRNELATFFDDGTPSESPSPAAAPPPSSTDAPAESAATDEKATRSEAKPPPAKSEPPAPEPAPETITLTKAEHDLLKRQAKDQAATAKRLREAEIALKAREGAFAQVAEKYQGTEVENEALRQWMNANTYTQNQITEGEQQETQAHQAALTLAQDKTKAALSLWQPYERPLALEAGALGLSESDLDAIVEQVKATDKGVKRLGQMFMAARTIEDAREFAEAGYTLLDQGVRAALQAKKLESLKEPDEPAPRPERRTHFGGSGATNADPYAHIKDMEVRARTRLRDGMAAELAKVFPQE